MIVKNPRLLTKFLVWRPKYSTKFGEQGEYCALIPTYKVDAASPLFLVEFTLAKHLQGLRYCIERSKAQSFPVTDVDNKSGGITPMYTIPLSEFESWETVDEVKEIATKLFEE